MKFVVDEDGVIIDELQDGDRILRKKSDELLNNKERTVYKNFCIINVDEYEAILKELDKSTKIVLMHLINKVQYSSCLIAHKNGKPIKKSDIVAITGLSKNTVENSLKILLEKDVIYKGKNSKELQWYINPCIAHKGKMTDKVLKTMFKNYKQRV